MTERFRNTDLWRDIRPLIFHETNWENAKADVDRGTALLKLLPGAAVLDIPCGPGRHALEFGRRGFRVTAVDLMPFFLERGSRRAQKEQLDIEFIQDDMRVFKRPSHSMLCAIFFHLSAISRIPRMTRTSSAIAIRI